MNKQTNIISKFYHHSIKHFFRTGKMNSITKSNNGFVACRSRHSQSLTLKCISGGFGLHKKYKRLPRKMLLIYSSSWGNHLYFLRRCLTICNFKEGIIF